MCIWGLGQRSRFERHQDIDDNQNTGIDENFQAKCTEWEKVGWGQGPQNDQHFRGWWKANVLRRKLKRDKEGGGRRAGQGGAGRARAHAGGAGAMPGFAGRVGQGLKKCRGPGNKLTQDHGVCGLTAGCRAAKTKREGRKWDLENIFLRIWTWRER